MRRSQRHTVECALPEHLGTYRCGMPEYSMHHRRCDRPVRELSFRMGAAFGPRSAATSCPTGSWMVSRSRSLVFSASTPDLPLEARAACTWPSRRVHPARWPLGNAALITRQIAVPAPPIWFSSDETEFPWHIKGYPWTRQGRLHEEVTAARGCTGILEARWVSRQHRTAGTRR